MLGVVDETRIVVGCITQTQDGRYSLEDLSASLPLDLSAAQVGHGFITGAAKRMLEPSNEASPYFMPSKPEDSRPGDWRLVWWLGPAMWCEVRLTL